MAVEITAPEAAALLGRGGVRLVDCREADEHALCRIEGAELIPLSIFSQAAPAALKDRGEPIILYCHAGVRSARAADYLTQLGYTQVRSLRGGIDAWSAEVDPEVPRY